MTAGTPMRRLIKEEEAGVIRASAAMTTGYVAGTVHNVSRFGAVALIATWTHGDETDMQILTEYGYVVAGTPAYAEDTTTAAPGSGESETSANVQNFTPANFTTGNTYALGVYDVGCWQTIRWSVKVTGGAAPGTLALWAVGGAL